jgi:hypothetical protein
VLAMLAGSSRPTGWLGLVNLGVLGGLARYFSFARAKELCQ